MDVIQLIIQYQRAFIDGLRVTFELCGITWAVGICLGAALGTAAHRWRWVVGTPLRALAFLLAGIPFLVLLYWAHYPLQVSFEVIVDPFYSAVSVLSLLNVVAVAEICRVALDDFPTEYVLAAKVCGLTRAETFARIQFPLILRQILPSLLTLQVTMLQMTLFASLISVEEIFRVAQRINSVLFRPVEIYTALAVFFLLICLPLNGAALYLRHRFTRNVSER